MILRYLSKTSLSLGGVLLYFSAITPVWAVNVSSWADFSTAENIVLTADIEATGEPQIITTNSGNTAQTIDGANHSLTGASGYQLKIQNTNEANGVTVKNFSVTGFDSGAFVFLAYPRKVTIDNVTFNNNTNEVVNITLNDVSSTSSITNTVFSGNKNTTNDKAVLTLGKGTFEIDNMVFDSNEAEDGIEFFSGTTTNINNSVFKNNIQNGYNHGYYDYGTLQIGSGVVHIDNSQFINNRTVINDGGAISVTNGMESVRNSVFKDNKAGNTGGAIWDMGDTDIHYYDNVRFEHNEAPYGGAIYAGLTSDISMIDTDFIGNIADEGAGLYVERSNLNIFAKTKDVTFSGNVANNATDTYNAGAAVYYDVRNSTDFAFNINAETGKKVIFDNTIAAYSMGGVDVNININKSGLTYQDISGTAVSIANSGEIQFNDKVGDEEGNIFNINLYGGKLSIGQNGGTNADGLIDNNNFTVAGDATLNTANGVIGVFSPATFNINAAMQYEFDLDLAAAKSDKLDGATNNGSLTLSRLNVITDTDAEDLKVTYSDTNINGTLKDGYSITTSTATYDVTAGNDDTGSYLLFTRGEDIGGLPAAIKNGSDAYSNTSGADEVVTAWAENDLKSDLAIDGNGHAITTENSLDGINVGSGYTLSVNNVTDMSGFNYALDNAGKVELTQTTISDDIINNGTLEVNQDVSLGNVSGTGTMNINSDHELTGDVAGNTVNVKSAKLWGASHLGSDTTLNVTGGTVDLKKDAVTVKSATFDQNSTLCLAVDSLSDYGHLTAETITVANGAKLKATLAQGIVKSGKTASVQLLSANNTDFNNFSDSFDNNMYHFEKADKNGKYNISLTSTAEDVVKNAGGAPWVARAAKAYIDSAQFEQGTVPADIANKFAGLAQNDAERLICEIKAASPTEAAVVQNQTMIDSSRLFKTVDSYLRGRKDPMGVSAGDEDSGVSIWAKPYVGRAKVNTNDKVLEQRTNGRGIIAAVEKQICPDFKLGAGIHYDETDIDMLSRDIDVESLTEFVYGEYKLDNWFVNATASYSSSDYDEKRFALGSKYLADYDVRAASIATVVGYQYNHFIPEVGLRYYHIRRDGYTDTALQHISGQTMNNLRATIGARFVTEYGMFTPNIYAGLNYDLVSPDEDTLVNLTNGTSYVVHGKRLPRLEGELDIGVNAHVNDNVTVGLSYMGAYRKNYQDHSGVLGLRYDF